MAETPSPYLALTEILKSLGLTKYEALVYIGLLKEPGATATRIHEVAGVPRASVYPVLERLIQKNMVSVSLATPRRFEAVPPDAAIDHLLDAVSADAVRAKKMLTKIWRERNQKAPADQGYIWSIYGIENIRARLADLLRNAAVSIDAVLFGDLPDDIYSVLCEKAASLPVKVTTRNPEKFACRGIEVSLLPSLPKDVLNVDAHFTGGFFLIDEERAMVVIVTGTGEGTALFSESRGFIRFFLSYRDLVSSLVKKISQ
ncbi:MAG: helix-turn-helix domain-containing protein [Methanolinea sp.]|nr:helix-turn-helix domain-containing protein [Methanolinea sp.]